MSICICKPNGTYVRTVARNLAPSKPTRKVTLQAPVGLGGANFTEDVRNIQALLNGVPLEDGGPQPILEEDGKCGSKTRDAIKNFQTKQFPGWRPDSRVDPGKKTLDNLNELSSRFHDRDGVSRKQYLEMARAYVPEVIRRVQIARQRLATASQYYQAATPRKDICSSKNLVDWHFKIHKASDPISSIIKIDQIYMRMQLVLSSQASGSRDLFEIGFARSQDEAVMYTNLGGWNAPDSERDDAGETFNRIKVLNRHGPGTVVHELGHLCGGRDAAPDSIVHIANPIPLPDGARVEDGAQLHNYRQMTPEEARRNCASYQSVSEPNPILLGPPVEVEW